MLTVILTFIVFAAYILILKRRSRAFFKVRSFKDFSSLLNARNSNLQAGLKVAELGTKRAVRDSFDATYHPATLGLRLMGTVLAPVLFYAGNTALLNAKGTDIPEEIAPWLGLALLVLVLWYLIYIWSYAVEVSRDTLRVPTLLFLRRAYPMDEIVRVDDTGAYFVKVRFRSGRSAEVLKYVAGREVLLEALARRVALAAEDPCQSSPKSKRFGAVSFR
ncbi:MAG: hypothetical protein AAGB05_11635 [Pseudomonadota bacterium]